MRTLKAFALSVLLAAMPSQAGAVDIDDFETGTHQDSEGPLPYRIFIPDGAPTGLPLIVFLHGSGERGTDNRRQVTAQPGFLAYVDESVQSAFPTYLVAPQLPNGQAWSNRAPAVLGLIDAIEQQYAIDGDRIVITGLSLGGEGTFELVARAPERFAAAVPMSGFYWNRLEMLDGALPPMWIFHAANDSIVPVDGSTQVVDRLESEGASYIYTEYATGGHVIWTRAYGTPGLVAWTLSQIRDQTTDIPPAIVLDGAADGVLSTTEAAVDLDVGVRTGGNVIGVEWRLADGPWMSLTASGTIAIAQVAVDVGDTSVRFRATDDQETQLAQSFVIRRTEMMPMDPPPGGGDPTEDGSGCRAVGAGNADAVALIALVGLAMRRRRRTPRA